MCASAWRSDRKCTDIRAHAKLADVIPPVRFNMTLLAGWYADTAEGRQCSRCCSGCCCCAEHDRALLHRCATSPALRGMKACLLYCSELNASLLSRTVSAVCPWQSNAALPYLKQLLLNNVKQWAFACLGPEVSHFEVELIFLLLSAVAFCLLAFIVPFLFWLLCRHWRRCILSVL